MRVRDPRALQERVEPVHDLREAPLTQAEAQAVLDNIEGHDPELVGEAMKVLGIAQDTADDIVDWVQWYRSMLQLGVFIIIVEGVAFAVMVWKHAYFSLPVIPYTMALVGFILGKMHERKKYGGR